MSYLIENHGKKQYEVLDRFHNQEAPKKRPVMGFAIITLGLTFSILLLWNINAYQVLDVHSFYLEETQLPLHIISKKFLSFGLDTSLLRNMKFLPIQNERFIKLARYLSPAFIRIGGTASDCLFFNESLEITPTSTSFALEDQDISNFTITGADFEGLYHFAKQSQLRMIFDLNVLIRNANGSWDYSNAEDIILFAKGHNMELAWQLGNEPNSFPHVFNRTVTAEELAKDYSRLRRLLDDSGYDTSLLVGPESNHIGDPNHVGENYVKEFLQTSGDIVDYVTWHQYYLNGHIARINEFLDPVTFQFLPMQIRSMNKLIESLGRNISMWLSETSSAYGGGAPGLSDRYVAGFLWLDKLGYSASAGINVVTRQTLFGGNYALIGPDIKPNPDWWISVIYKELVSTRVLKLTPSNYYEYVRLYAHCTAENARINRVPAITIYGINIRSRPVKVALQGLFPTVVGNITIFYYALTSDSLTSREIKMNGKVLQLQRNGDLPPFRAIILQQPKIISLPRYSMIFMVIHGVEVPACIY